MCVCSAVSPLLLSLQPLARGQPASCDLDGRRGGTEQPQTDFSIFIVVVGSIYEEPVPWVITLHPVHSYCRFPLLLPGCVGIREEERSPTTVQGDEIVPFVLHVPGVQTPLQQPPSGLFVFEFTSTQHHSF